jgi:hypothetical protein
MRGIFPLAVLTALGALGSPAMAAGGSIWDHNGSKMTLEENGDKRKLVYSELRQGLDKAGIKVGTVLFNGERKADGRFAGFARVFKANCNPVDYFVEGTLNEGKGEIVLQGQAPTYTSGTSCEVNGYSDASPASTLTFTKISDAPSAVVAERNPADEVEQGDRTPDNDEYLPPSQRDRAGTDNNTARPEPLAPRAQQPSQAQPPQDVAPREQARTPPPPPATQNRRAETDDDDIDESQPPSRYERYREYDRRFSRAPDPQEDRPYRRRPGIWEPEDDMEAEPDDGYYDEPPPPSPFWGRRGRW